MKNPYESITFYQEVSEKFLKEFSECAKTPFTQHDGIWGKGVPIDQAEKEQEVRACMLSGGAYVEKIEEPEPPESE